MGCFLTTMSFTGIQAQSTSPADNDTQETIKWIKLQ